MADKYVALTTFLVALATLSIAFVTWRAQNLDKKEKLFDRRYSIYIDSLCVVQVIINTDSVYDLADEHKLSWIRFQDSIPKSKFIFSHDVHCFMKRIERHVNDYVETDAIDSARPLENHSKLKLEMHKILGEFDSKFSPYLKL